MIEYRGLSRIDRAFSEALRGDIAALMPYFTLGYPSMAESVEIIKAIAPICDLLELGIPFSDPIADGPTIQRSTQKALNNGVTTAKCLEMVELIRASGVTSPLLLMGYYNPILAYNEEQFVKDAASAGADGLIIPDLPPEESNGLLNLTKDASLALIQFLAPTSTEKRIETALTNASGYIYMVSITGVTGSRDGIGRDIAAYVTRIKARTTLPVAVGFGIKTPEQAKEVGSYADGVIIGSALIEAVDKGGGKPEAALELLKPIKQALKSDSGSL